MLARSQDQEEGMEAKGNEAIWGVLRCSESMWLYDCIHLSKLMILLKWVNCVGCKFYLNKADLKKCKRCTSKAKHLYIKQ